ncbi:MAG TPA: hypothetical protein VFI56_06315 [Vicinamibacterales bacterium]|nr:hypothetical protein [Vicinamibacterales bacterium]
MRSVKAIVVLCAALLSVAAAGAGTLSNHRNVLGFSGPVALPGVSLAAGSYIFEILDPNASTDVVVVRNSDHTQVFYMGLTRRIDRPASLARGRFVTFGESARGNPAPISAWYPLGESRGYEFLYARR